MFFGGVLWVSLGFIEVSSVVGITFESDTVKSLRGRSQTTFTNYEVIFAPCNERKM